MRLVLSNSLSGFSKIDINILPDLSIYDFLNRSNIDDFNFIIYISGNKIESDFDLKIRKIKWIKSKIVFWAKAEFNSLFDKNYSERCWEILIGHWLERYITFVCYRFEVLESILIDFEVSEIVFSNTNSSILDQINESNDFVTLSNSNQFNSLVYFLLFKEFFQNKYPLIKVIDENSILDINTISNLKNIRLKNSLKRVANNIFSSNNKYFIYNSFLSFKNELLLSLKFWQIPFFTYNLSSKYLCESHSRIFKEVQVGETIDISAFLIKYFFWFIPKSYYENFIQINDIIFKFFPKNIPNVIFTSNSFDTDDIFKVYLISRINLGSKYFVGQHGAQFGVNKYYLNTNEIVTTDSFFTWGWGGYGKFYKGVFLKKSIVSSFKFRSKILLVQKCIDHSILPYDNFYEYERYISKQFNFVNKLKRDFKSQIVVRIMAGSKNLKGYDFERWQQINLPIDQGVLKISEVISNYKLVIFTYDSTVMYEIIDSGIPFIFVSFENYFISDEAKPFFAKLKKSNIYFDNYEAAINFLNNNLNFIDQWWSSDLVQISLAEFKNKFCNNIYSPNASLFNFISNNNI